MRHETVTVTKPTSLDWKAIGYLVSIVGVLFLGATAWPEEDAPVWHLPALIVGVSASIIGMGCRYLAHLQTKREIDETKRKKGRR